MSQVCTPSNRWFQAYSPQHYTHYLKIKCLSEWSLGTYEKIYVRLDSPIPKTHVNSAIASAKHALKLAKQFKTEAADFPSKLRHLMKLDWEYSMESCMTIHEVIEGTAEGESQLLELQRNYIAQKSQHVDEDDLDMRLERSNNAFIELGRRLFNSSVPNSKECEAIFKDANEPLEIDLEEMIIQIRDSIDHTLLKDSKSKFKIYLIKNYDERFAMQRKAIRFLRGLMKSIENSEDYAGKEDMEILKDSETIPIELNYLYRCSSRILMDELLTDKN